LSIPLIAVYYNSPKNGLGLDADVKNLLSFMTLGNIGQQDIVCSSVDSSEQDETDYEVLLFCEYGTLTDLYSFGRQEDGCKNMREWDEDCNIVAS
jgi:hypothetical protein